MINIHPLPMGRRLSITAIVFVFLAGAAYAQPARFLFEKLTVEDGLSHNVVRNLLFDSRGFLWVATSNGLNRFDGYTFRNYSYDPNDSTSLSHDIVGNMLEDREGNIWVSTRRGGLCRYNRKTDNFTRFLPDPGDSTALGGNNIGQVFEDKDGTIWIGHQQGLDKMVIENGQISFFHFRHDPKDSTSLVKGRIISINQDRHGTYWIGSDSGGLCSLPLSSANNPSGFNRIPYFIRTTHSRGLRDDTVFDLAIDHDGNLWIATGRGLAKIQVDQLDREQPDIIHYEPRFFAPGNPNSGVVHDLEVSPAGEIWMAGGYYLHKYDAHQDSILTYPLTDHGVTTKRFNVLFKVIFDPAGRLWIATMEGLVRTADANPHFHAIPVSVPNSAGGKTSFASAVLKDRSGQLWLGMENGGISIYDQAGTSYLRITNTSPPGRRISHNFIMEIFESSDGRIWVASYGGGLAEIKLQRDAAGKITNYSVKLHYEDPRLLQARFVYDIMEDSKGRLWIADYFAVNRYDTPELMSARYPVFVANEIIEGQDQTIWIGTDNGLFRYDEELDSLLRPAGTDSTSILQKERITTFYQSKNGDFWVGSLSGLLHTDPNMNPVKWYREGTGVIGDVVSGILEDERGRIWLSTKRGLVRLDPASGEMMPYSMNDGIFNYEFAYRGCFKDPDGIMHFGGENGVLFFHPDSIREDTYQPPLILTDFLLFGESVPTEGTIDSTSDIDFFLPTHISETRSLRLAHHQNVITFEFAALGYRQAAQYVYDYKLDGFDPDWRSTPSTDRKATYTNLDPGTYTFMVKATNPDGFSDKPPIKLELVIDPPWWRTWWAYILYVLVGGWAIYTLIRYRTRKVREEMKLQARIEQAKVEERERVRARSSRDFHDEAGNKITKISLYTGLTKRKAEKDPEMTEYLNRIEENVKELSSGMRDFIWALDPKKDNFQELWARIEQFGLNLFEHTQVEYTTQNRISQEENFALDLNARRHLVLMFKEAMNNALKYAHCSTIRLEAKKEADTLILSLTDNGLGFDKDTLVRVNGLENMRTRAVEIGGELEVQSVPGMGTSIIFKKEIHPNG